jgi:hypothetical protein
MFLSVEDIPGNDNSMFLSVEDIPGNDNSMFLSVVDFEMVKQLRCHFH